MKPNSKSRNMLIVAAVLNAIVFGIFLFTFFTIKAKNERISSLTNETEQYLERDTMLRSIQGVLADTKDDLSLINSYFVSQDGAVDFIETVESVGRQSGIAVSIGSVSVQGGEEESQSVGEMLKLGVKTEGSWKNSIYFLELVESIPFKTHLEKASFLTKKGDRSGVWKGEVEFSVFKLK